MAIPSAAVASSDERLMAGVVHSMSLIPGLGLIVPLWIWISQRKWSKFVAYHALQALVYQLLELSTMIILAFLGVLVGAPFAGLYLSRLLDGNGGGFPVLIPVLWVIFFFGMFTLLALSGLAAGVSLVRGKDFSYLFIGSWLIKYLQED